MTYDSPQPYGGGAAAPAQRYNVLAIVGFILAFVVNIAGVVVSIIALTQLKKTGEKGRGLAIAGVIIGGISIVIGVISVISVFALAASQGVTTSP